MPAGLPRSRSRLALAHSCCNHKPADACDIAPFTTARSQLFFSDIFARFRPSLSAEASRLAPLRSPAVAAAFNPYLLHLRTRRTPARTVAHHGRRRCCLPPHRSALPEVRRDSRYINSSAHTRSSHAEANPKLSSIVGRDKFLRTLQYWSRFYAWYLYRTNNPQAKVAQYDAVKKNFGMARKLLRLGKFVEHFKAAAIAADAKGMDAVLKYCAIGRQLGYAGYMLLDNLTVVSRRFSELVGCADVG